MPKEVIQSEIPDFRPPEGLPDMDSFASAASAATLGSSIKKLADAMKTLNSNADNLQVQLPRVPKSSLADLAKVNLPENPQYKTNRLLAELIEKIDTQNKQNAKLLAPNFDQDSCSIIFSNKPIPIKRDSNQAQLCKSLFKDLSKIWDWSDMIEDWGYADWQKDDWRKVYEAARSVNEKVAIKTGVEDLLIYTKTTVGINPAYLSSS